MKNIYKIVIVCMLSGLLATACNQESDLPYPINDVKKGVLVDVSLKPGTDAFIDAIAPDVEPSLGVSLNIVPKGDGPWEKIDLVVIYQNAINNTFSKYVYQSGITTLPQDIDLDYNKILQGFNLERENPGDNFSVVVDIHLPDGLILFGWTPYSGFTNTDFASWQYNGRGYRHRVVYPAACPIDPNFWAGPVQTLEVKEDYVEDGFLTVLPEDDVPEPSYFESLGMSVNDINALDMVGFELEGLYLDSDPLTMEGNTSKLKIWIDRTSFRVFIPEQSTSLYWNIGAALGQADDFQEVWVTEIVNAEANTCNGTISFTSDWMPIGDSVYGFGEMEFIINVLAFNDQVKNDKNSPKDLMHLIKKR